MADRLTERVKQVLELASQEAFSRGSDHISPHHLLLALLRYDNGWRSHNNTLIILRRRGLSIDELCRNIESEIGNGRKLKRWCANASMLPQDAQTRLVLDKAHEATDLLSEPFVMLQHLLYGLSLDAVGKQFAPVSLVDVRDDMYMIRSTVAAY